MTAKLSNLQRILRILKFYYQRGCNKESVNRIYFAILKEKYSK